MPINEIRNYINNLRNILRAAGFVNDPALIMKILATGEESFNNNDNCSENDFLNSLNKYIGGKERIFPNDLYFITKNLLKNIYNSKTANTILQLKYEIVQEILSTNNFKGFVLETPKRLFNSLILKNKLKAGNKVLIPEVKTGGLLIETLYYLASKESQNINSIYQDVTAFSFISKTEEFVKLATHFIFGVEYSLRLEDFLTAKINDKFDIVICNPPFGKIIKNIQDYKEFEFCKIRKNTPSELLFLEKIQSTMAPNSYLSIVLPNNILENIMNQDARKWISNNFKIIEILSLYIGAFKPMTNIKTSILILKKITDIDKNYNVKLSLINSEEDLLSNKKNSFDIPIKKLSDINYSPEFYQRKGSSFLLDLAQCKATTIKEITKLILKEKAKILKDSTQYFRYIDLSSVDAKTGEIREAKDIKVSEAPKRAYYEINKDDLLIAVSGGGIGTKSHVITVVDAEHDKCVCSNGFRVLKLQDGINPYYMWYFMRSEYFLGQVNQLSAGSTIPNLKENDLMDIKVFIPPIEVQKSIEEKVKDNINKLKEAETFLCSNEQTLKTIMEGGL